MESTNNKNNNYREGQQQLQKSARKLKFNELANESHGQAATVGGEQKEQQPPEKLSKKNCGGQQGNDAFEELQLESLPREELINLVRKQEAAKKEAEESAKQQTKEMTIKMEELNKTLLANQQKVEQLTEEIANQLNVEYQQKYLDRAKQAEEFSQRILHLEQEKAEVHAELGKKLAEIEGMHKEVEQKSEEVAKKAKQIDALLVQLIESIKEQHHLHTDQQMKIQLSLETWFDWLAFVPRHQLGKIVPMIGDRKFASIIQKFLDKYGEITIEHIEIVAPYKEDSDGHPRVRLWQNNRPLRFEIAETKMPANIKNFKSFKLSYFDQSVLNFIQKFQQNGLLDNVNLWFSKLSSKAIIQPVLCRILPLINGIKSIGVGDNAQLVDFYDAGNSKEIYEMNMKMMEKTRYLFTGCNRENFHATKINLYCRWLYQTVHAFGKPRVLHIERLVSDTAPICLFIDRLKQDFLMATDPVSFFIRINLPKAFQILEDICLDNAKTKEKLMTKMEEVKWELVLQISRYPLASTKIWIEENEKEIFNWDFNSRTICLTEELNVVAI